jgi:hypothetical protein
MLITEEMIQAALARADWPKLHIPFFFVPGYVVEEDEQDATRKAKPIQYFGDIIQSYDEQVQS